MIHAGGKRAKSLELINQLLDESAVAIKLQEHFHQATCTMPQRGSILVPVNQAVQRLSSARTAADESGIQVRIFACTEARTAIAITGDSDKCDHKYLSGLISGDGNHTYCGGLDATIGRALLYAPYADVVCFKSPVACLSEAKRFADAIRAEFPDKKLAFGYSAKPDGLRWNEIDHAELRSELQSLGYDYYFFTQFGYPVFPDFPSESPWAMFDDVLRGSPSNIHL